MSDYNPRSWWDHFCKPHLEQEKVMSDSVKKHFEMVSEEEMDKLEGTTVSDAVEVFETEYPELSAEYKKIGNEMYEMFARKHMDYGLNNIALGGDILNNEADKKFSLTGLAIRLTDKISRLKNLLVNQNASIFDCMQYLNDTAEKCLIVTDNRKKLLGTITDGDIRRALMNHREMDSSVEEIMHKDPLTSLNSDTSELIMSKMKSRNLLHMPIINEEGVVVGLETLQHLTYDKKYDNY